MGYETASSLFGGAAVVTAGRLPPAAARGAERRCAGARRPATDSPGSGSSPAKLAEVSAPKPTDAGIATAMPATRATRYIAPLREGGSLPGLVEAEDLGTWVVKFRGAGQGPGALVAELVGGELGRAVGLPVPELSLIEVPIELGRAEPDPEVRELIEASPGLNLAMDFLPGALPFTLPPGDSEQLGVDRDLAAEILFFDGLITNIDRSPRNPNLLVWHGRTWLIDHGAAFFRQHGQSLAGTARTPTPALRDHVMLPAADRSALEAAADRLAGPALEAVPRIIELIPDEWLGDRPGDLREDFLAFLTIRLQEADMIVDELAGYMAERIRTGECGSAGVEEERT